MKSKILISLMVTALLLSLSITGFVFYIFLSIDEMPVTEFTATDETIAQSIPENTSEETDKNQDTEYVQDIETTQDIEGTMKSDEYIKEEEPLKIAAVGDILLGRSVKTMVEKQESRYIYPFEEVADILDGNDVVFGNLEEPITASTKGLAGIKQGGKYVLKNEPEAVNGIKFTGFNLLSLANNHILDYYEKGLLDTMNILDENGIAYAGAGRNLEEARKLTVLEKNNLKIGMLAYTDMSEVLYKGNPPIRFIAKENTSGVAPTKKEYILEDIAKARESVDILIVSLHWGVEYSYEPTAEQVELAHKIIDSGADILIGHHAHRCQGVEIYDGKPILYNLGNFLFDQNNPLNQEGFIFKMELKDHKLTALSGIPFKIINKSRIIPQKGSGASEMLEREMNLSGKLNTSSYLEDSRIIFNLDSNDQHQSSN